MINEILNSYRFRGKLRRVPFVLTVVVLSAVIGYVSYALRRMWLTAGGSDNSYVVMAWSTELLVALLVLPLCVARLRDIGWSPFLAALVLLSPLLSPTLMVIFALNQGETLSAPQWFSNAIAVASVALLLFLIALALWKGENRSAV